MWTVSTIFSVLSAVFWLVNYKNIPTAWHYRFYKSLFYFFYVNKNPKAIEENVFRTRVWKSRSSFMECDLNGHKSNSTYFSDLDIARTDLMVDVFKKTFLDTKKKTGKWIYLPLGAVATVFRREIKPFAAYTIKSKIVAWDDKWLFVVSKFEMVGIPKTCAISVTKYVFKMGRKTIPPADALKDCGLWTPEAEAKARAELPKCQGLLDLDQLEDEEF
ncbi:hypothetical protein V1512DRAFT_229362 [Lipomyces arxii]|uniref:uncharacterized protein n=1 Tax=Lipomyces arxii TaxID=56418 RepID=UPI0034CED667